jgi:TolB-like protein
MGADEEDTLRRLEDYRGVIHRLIERHHGRFVGTSGDSVLAEFASVVEAVTCAVKIQRVFGARNRALEEARRMAFRIGVNLGDVMVRGEDLYGDGVNIAARVESLAEPGGVCVSGTVREHVRNKTAYVIEPLGTFEVKNIAEPVSIYRVAVDQGAVERSARYLAQAGLNTAQTVATAGISSVQMVARASASSAQLVTRASRRALAGAGAAAAIAAIAATVLWYEVLRPPPEEAAEAVSAPGIAVLPFDNLSGDPAQDYFADGLSEDIITELSRFSELLVLARNSTFQYKGRAVDVTEIGHELGARFVLEGSVRRSGEDLRITAQLIDAETGGHLWGERYDVPAARVFEVQDEITREIVSTLDIKVHEADLGRALRKHPDNLEAYDLVLRAQQYTRRYSQDAHATARAQLERAVVLEPTYARAHAWLAQLYLDEVNLGFNPRPDAIERALGSARKAVELDPNDAWAHYVLAKIYHRARQFDLYQAEVEKALALNPNDAEMLADLGAYMFAAGRFETGAAMVRKAARVNPNHPNWFHFTWFFDHYRKGAYERALAEAEQLTMDELYWTHAVAAAAHGQLGNRAEAEAAVARLNALNPDFADRAREEFEMWFASESLIESLVEGLRKAGLAVPG